MHPLYRGHKTNVAKHPITKIRFWLKIYVGFSYLGARIFSDKIHQMTELRMQRKQHKRKKAGRKRIRNGREQVKHGPAQPASSWESAFNYLQLEKQRGVEDKNVKKKKKPIGATRERDIQPRKDWLHGRPTAHTFPRTLEKVASKRPMFQHAIVVVKSERQTIRNSNDPDPINPQKNCK